jgi:hypothetical protein
VSASLFGNKELSVSFKERHGKSNIIPLNLAARQKGNDWPVFAMTMTGKAR